ncbi:MAG TPA: four helix bundle protein [Gemmatimonadaceae bacterium]|nr:four helix bundle protein [Gemmatimonadaceae bacterium]
MSYEEWLGTVPLSFTGDTLWRVNVYRLALYAADLAWLDTTILAANRRTLHLSDQLLRSVNSISTSVAEGFSRQSGKKKARFYEYSLGSSREARDWYYKARHVLPGPSVECRLEEMTSIVRLLNVMVARERLKVRKREAVARR